MQVKTFTPSDNLKPFVKYFCFLKSDDALPKEQKSYRIVADGCPGIIIQSPDAGGLFREEKQLPSSFLFGQSTKHADLQVNGRFNMVCAFLQPHALKSLFKINAEELTDSCVEINLLGKGFQFNMPEELERDFLVEQQVEMLNAYLQKLCVSNHYSEHASMNIALNKIIRSKGTVSLKELQKELGISERSLERKFKQYTGLSPKMFSRITSFQSSLQQLSTREFKKLSDIAYENNYADQAHFIKSFKEFTGFSPNQYQKQSVTAVENLSTLVP